MEKLSPIEIIITTKDLRDLKKTFRRKFYLDEEEWNKFEVFRKKKELKFHKEMVDFFAEIAKYKNEKSSF